MNFASININNNLSLSDRGVLYSMTIRSEESEDRSVSIAQLREEIKLSDKTTRRHLKKLVNLGVIYSQRSKNDGRVMTYFLSNLSTLRDKKIQQDDTESPPDSDFFDINHHVNKIEHSEEMTDYFDQHYDDGDEKIPVDNDQLIDDDEEILDIYDLDLDSREEDTGHYCPVFKKLPDKSVQHFNVLKTEICLENKQKKTHSKEYIYKHRLYKALKALKAFKSFKIKAKEKKKINKKEKKVLDTTDQLSLPDFLEASLWQDFLDHRTEIKKPMSPLAQKKMFGKLEKLLADGQDVRTVLERSIINRWQDVYPAPDQKGIFDDAREDYEPYSENEHTPEAGFEDDAKWGYQKNDPELAPGKRRDWESRDQAARIGIVRPIQDLMAGQVPAHISNFFRSIPCLQGVERGAAESADVLISESDEMRF